jgi:cytochrome b6-f complex iron-sulfur subunit
MTTSANPSERPSVFIERRQFILLGLGAVGAAWAGTLIQTRLFPPQPTAQEAKPVSFPLAELPIGGVKTITYAGLPAIVLRTPESIRCFSLICTHLGCTVLWQAEKGEFYCPCHDGIFDQFGEVISGPPPIPLEAYPVRVEGEQVIVGEA